jgi:hypothetical protein
MALERLQSHHVALRGLLDALGGPSPAAPRDHLLGELTKVASAHIFSVERVVLPYLRDGGLAAVCEVVREGLASISEPLSALIAARSSSDDFIDGLVVLRDAVERMVEVEREVLLPALQGAVTDGQIHLLGADIETAAETYISAESVARLAAQWGRAGG